MTEFTKEQRRILRHPPSSHGRVFAGPGTGKSTTVLALAERLAAEEASVRVITFTRAAASELALKAVASESAIEPVTVHSYALSLLMGNPGLSELPEPLRIPDDWEVKELLRPDVRDLLKAQGFDVDVRAVGRLEREMAARWESLDPRRVLSSELDPGLRDAYLAAWNSHRRVFGYSLFAEMPLAAQELLDDHPQLDLAGLEFLIVDEYQDLNKCEVEMLRSLAARDVKILAVGDDDQSIYGFRMADPQGIREFVDDFDPVRDYELSVSHRCGQAILDPARSVIEAMPGRPAKRSLAPAEGNPSGVFRYLSFANNESEAAGVARLALLLTNRRQRLRPNEIAIMMRGDSAHAWSNPLRSELDAVGIDSVDVEAALQPLKEPASRFAIALARLAENRNDSIAWWALLRLTHGIARNFEVAIAVHAAQSKRRFGNAVLSLADDPPPEASRQSLSHASGLVGSVSRFLSETDTRLIPHSDLGFGPWFVETAQRFGAALSDEASQIALQVGAVTPQDQGISHFLNQLEPVTKDQALRTDGIAIMPMTRSKGLTFRAAIVMGVENGIIPSPRNEDEDEERRLLYVAMTRPTEFLYLTMATRRTGPTARSGRPRVMATRSRSPFFRATTIKPQDGRAYLRRTQSGVLT